MKLDSLAGHGKLRKKAVVVEGGRRGGVVVQHVSFILRFISAVGATVLIKHSFFLANLLVWISTKKPFGFLKRNLVLKSRSAGHYLVAGHQSREKLTSSRRTIP